MSGALRPPLIARGARALRAVGPEDLDRLRDWRNQEHIRAASLSQEVIEPDAHSAWFARMLTRTDGIWAVYEIDRAPIGHVNAVHCEKGAERWRWSFYIGAVDAPHGEGSAMLALMLQLLFEERGAQAVEAIALSGNPASLAIHAKLGFRELGPVDPAQSKQVDARFFLLDHETWEKKRGALFEKLARRLEGWA